MGWTERLGVPCLRRCCDGASGWLEGRCRSLGKKYTEVIQNNFKATRRLWEKYNVETDGLDVVGEYGQVAMLGWTAGVYVAL